MNSQSIIHKLILTTNTLLLGATFSTYTMAFESQTLGTIKPYLGAGVDFTRLNSPDHADRTMFKNTYPGVNLTAGLQFEDYWGLEFGYGSIRTKNNEHIFQGGETIPGFGFIDNPPAGHSIAYLALSTLKIHDWNIGLICRIPLNALHPMLQNTNIFIRPGISQTNISGAVRVPTVYIDNASYSVQIQTPFSFHAKKTLPFVHLGINQRFTNKIHFRIFSEWKQLNKLKLTTRLNSIRFKNSTKLGCNIFYIF